MDKWTKIEEILNGLLQNFGKTLSRIFLSLTPAKIKSKFQESQKKITSQNSKLRKSFKERSQQILTNANKTKNKTLEKAGKIHSVTRDTISAVKQTKPKEAPKKMLALLMAFLLPTFSKLKSIYASLNPGTIITFVTLSTVGSLSGIQIYKASKEISEKAERSAQEEAELVAKLEKANAISRRPAYFRKAEKQFRVSNIILPAYLEKKKGIKKLVIDFTFESSNKYIKAYFWENPHLIQDVLNSKIEPIAVDFPLLIEGKEIITNKIRKEMNLQIKKIGIKGKINSVHIHSIIGG